MSVRVRDIIEVEILKNYRLLAGEGGLDNIVLAVNIFEYILNKTHDRTGELYLTSFYSIKELGENALFEHISILIDTNCPGLLMGDGMYDSISDDIKRLADKNNFPIISINESILYSDVLQSAYKRILKGKLVDRNSVILDRIMMLEDEYVIDKYIRKINNNFKDHYAILYIKSDLDKKYLNNLFNSENKINNTIIDYKNDTIMIITFDKHISDIKGNMLQILQIDDIEDNGYYIGISSCSDDYSRFKKNMIDAKYACIVSKIIRKKSVESVYNIGIYKLLISISENPEVVEFSRQIIGKVKEYDKKYNLDILETFLMYLKCSYDINETSEKLFLHKNTVRYRLKKIEIIINNSNNDCMEQLAMAVRILKLKNEL